MTSRGVARRRGDSPGAPKGGHVPAPGCVRSSPAIFYCYFFLNFLIFSCFFLMFSTPIRCQELAPQSRGDLGLSPAHCCTPKLVFQLLLPGGTAERCFFCKLFKFLLQKCIGAKPHFEIRWELSSKWQRQALLSLRTIFLPMNYLFIVFYYYFYYYSEFRLSSRA